MTPDVQAAADRLTAYLHLTEAPDRITTDLRALLAALDEQHEQLRVLQATLAEILPTFREKGHPGYDATRSCWLETRRVDGWRAIAGRTIIPCGATTLGLYSTPLRPCIYAAGHIGHHRNDDGTIWVERVDSAGSGPNADADA